MSKSLSANFSGPFQVGAFENYLSKFSIEYREKKKNDVFAFESSPFEHRQMKCRTC